VGEIEKDGEESRKVALHQMAKPKADESPITASELEEFAANDSDFGFEMQVLA
jgi:hypothetical protein